MGQRPTLRLVDDTDTVAVGDKGLQDQLAQARLQMEVAADAVAEVALLLAAKRVREVFPSAAAVVVAGNIDGDGTLVELELVEVSSNSSQRLLDDATDDQVPASSLTGRLMQPIEALLAATGRTLHYPMRLELPPTVRTS